MTALRHRLRDGASFAAALVLKAPIHLYRYTLKAFLGWHCRHLPTCSEYALEAIDRNGPWRGLWLTTARVCRCRPGGSRGWDPVPDVRSVRHPLAPWRYARWDSFVGTIEAAGDPDPARTEVRDKPSIA